MISSASFSGDGDAITLSLSLFLSQYTHTHLLFHGINIRHATSSFSSISPFKLCLTPYSSAFSSPPFFCSLIFFILPSLFLLVVVFIIILPWEAMSRIQQDCVNLHQAFRGSFFFSFSVLKISQMFDSFHFSMFSDILDFPYVHNRNVVCAKMKNRKICLAETPNSLQCQTCR